MSNVATDKLKNVMLSKILISQSEGRKPAIKITEKYSDDVRDLLVVNLRQDLRHTSATFTIEFMEQSQDGIEYLITPVSDELDYFKGRIRKLMRLDNLNPASSDPEIVSKFKIKSEDVNGFIDDFFSKIRQCVE